ncbi:hydroxyacylglutathione hydrolase [Moraxella bovis]|uniref:Hydroxyacylglutathione hydrolase n=1 Tax=Moraxella bovis TaxID=476 RepID=A0AAQ2SYK4_MORBO|nr:hydroxyacylglutathione hydrolase [Moraxella bovis]AWY20528.1 hydroxyacylglutathione hydrolase [Moraxella bovis]UYZ76795.1 hydroxyacylglutathione hydrolase [Moraxella bovis]UYZ77250.1 hydroxyacylglutathione hydrolase [Moraxella bovis]UYZ82267.1 hydroxyacylglutathione hydrolase [Moraxella bovis]UYZ85737.1 hydroxyacylglutathione hydrolase [Moraxella bovis]
MHITPIPILNDNYVWLLVKDNNAVAVDIGDDKPVLDYLHEHNLTLSAILITHHHDDHIGGVASAKSAYPNAKIYAHKSHLNAIGMTPDVACDEGSEFELLGLTFKVWKTAGHTDTHLSYLCDMANITHVFCGDTLFSGGCGRVFTGTIGELFDSMERFGGLPEETLFYPTHEYTLSNLTFALSVCADKYKEKIIHHQHQVKDKLANQIPSLPTTLKVEKSINVFLQTDDKDMVANIKKHYPLTSDDELSIFTALRELKNGF